MSRYLWYVIVFRYLGSLDTLSLVRITKWSADLFTNKSMQKRNFQRIFGDFPCFFQYCHIVLILFRYLNVSGFDGIFLFLCLEWVQFKMKFSCFRYKTIKPWTNENSKNKLSFKFYQFGKIQYCSLRQFVCSQLQSVQSMFKSSCLINYRPTLHWLQDNRPKIV